MEASLPLTDYIPLNDPTLLSSVSFSNIMKMEQANLFQALVQPSVKQAAFRIQQMDQSQLNQLQQTADMGNLVKVSSMLGNTPEQLLNLLEAKRAETGNPNLNLGELSRMLIAQSGHKHGCGYGQYSPQRHRSCNNVTHAKPNKQGNYANPIKSEQATQSACNDSCKHQESVSLCCKNFNIETTAPEQGKFLSSALKYMYNNSPSFKQQVDGLKGNNYNITTTCDTCPNAKFGELNSDGSGFSINLAKNTDPSQLQYTISSLMGQLSELEQASTENMNCQTVSAPSCSDGDGKDNTENFTTDDLKIGLYDADTDTLIKQLEDGDEILMSEIEGRNVTIAAFVPQDSPLSGKVESMLLNLNDGQQTQRENVEPYALFGNRKDNFFGKSDFLPMGDNKISFELYSKNKLKGDHLGTLSMNFKVVDDSTADCASDSTHATSNGNVDGQPANSTSGTETSTSGTGTDTSTGSTGGASSIDATLADLKATYEQIAAQNLAIGKAQLEGRQLTQRAKASQTAGESAPTQ